MLIPNMFLTAPLCQSEAQATTKDRRLLHIFMAVYPSAVFIFVKAFSEFCWMYMACCVCEPQLVMTEHALDFQFFFAEVTFISFDHTMFQ